MKEVSTINKITFVVMPLFGSIASMVSGYFIVYLTMLEESFKSYHKFTNDQNDFYFSIMTAALPVGAFLGTKYVI